MEIKIGVQHTGRELVLESSLSADEVLKAVSEAIEKDTVLTLADDKGRQVLVPAAKLGYVEIGVQETRRVGFGTI